MVQWLITPADVVGLDAIHQRHERPRSVSDFPKPRSHPEIVPIDDDQLAAGRGNHVPWPEVTVGQVLAISCRGVRCEEVVHFADQPANARHRLVGAPVGLVAEPRRLAGCPSQDFTSRVVDADGLGSPHGAAGPEVAKGVVDFSKVRSGRPSDGFANTNDARRLAPDEYEFLFWVRRAVRNWFHCHNQSHTYTDFSPNGAP